MQLVGRRCELCAKDILLDRRAVGCVACDRVFHRACLEDPKVCRACGQAFSATIARTQRHEAETRRRGALLASTALGSLPLVSVATLLHAAYSGHTELLPTGFVRLVITAALSWAVWRGARWARRLLQALIALGAIGFVGLAGAIVAGALPAHSLHLILAIYNALIYGVDFAILTFVPDVRRFLDAQTSG